MLTAEMEKRIAEVEREYIIVNVEMKDGKVKEYDILNEDDFDNIVRVEVISFVDFEENGYDVEGLEKKWMQF